VDAFTVRLDLTLFDGGRTVVRLPPFGRIEANTHLGPAGLGLTLVDVDLGLLGRMVATSTRAAATRRVERVLRRDAALFTVWVLLLAAGGGAALPLLVGERDARRLRGGALAGLAAVGAVVLLTWGSYRVSAFRQPRYVGALRAAPWMVGLLDTTFSQARRFEAQLPLIASGLYRLFGAIQHLQPLAERQGWRTVMLVSDIHDNPAAYTLMRRLAATFHPDFVLDAGDLTDDGTTFETDPLRREIPSLHLPYLIAPGNHESPTEIAILRRIPGVTILDGQEVVEDGVPIVGIADPSSRNALPTVAPAPVLAAAARRLAADVRAAPIPPTIVVAHNPNVIAPLVGMAPVLFNGHTHTIWVRRVAGGVWLNDGTTGAAGIRGITTEVPVPYSLMILYIAESGGRQYARAVETIRLTEVTGTMSVTQEVFAPPPATASP
jgi:predicted phosphodiesterase